MSPASTSSEELCHVLARDAGLAEAIPPEQREQAIARCTARQVSLAPTRWRASPLTGAGAGVGLLVLEGLLVRRVGIEARFGAELLGEGDLLRPWEGEEEPPTLPLATGWRVLERARLAVLDESFMGHLARYPHLASALIGRAVVRSRHVTANMAIVHQARVDVRLHMLLWHLAARWGRVGSEGVVLPLRLTHAVLAELAAARRPTVTSALGALACRGLVRPVAQGWVLTGDPPGHQPR